MSSEDHLVLIGCDLKKSIWIAPGSFQSKISPVPSFSKRGEKRANENSAFAKGIKGNLSESGTLNL
jgi:hypothetical protein